MHYNESVLKDKQGRKCTDALQRECIIEREARQKVYWMHYNESVLKEKQGRKCIGCTTTRVYWKRSKAESVLDALQRECIEREARQKVYWMHHNESVLKEKQGRKCIGCTTTRVYWKRSKAESADKCKVVRATATSDKYRFSRYLVISYGEVTTLAASLPVVANDCWQHHALALRDTDWNSGFLNYHTSRFVCHWISECDTETGKRQDTHRNREETETET